jgi:hypothetical protein
VQHAITRCHWLLRTVVQRAHLLLPLCAGAILLIPSASCQDRRSVNIEEESLPPLGFRIAQRTGIRIASMSAANEAALNVFHNRNRLDASLRWAVVHPGGDILSRFSRIPLSNWSGCPRMATYSWSG